MTTRKIPHYQPIPSVGIFDPSSGAFIGVDPTLITHSEIPESQSELVYINPDEQKLHAVTYLASLQEHGVTMGDALSVKDLRQKQSDLTQVGNKLKMSSKFNATDLTYLVNSDQAKALEEPMNSAGFEYLKRLQGTGTDTALAEKINKLIETAEKAGVKNPTAIAQYMVTTIDDSVGPRTELPVNGETTTLQLVPNKEGLLEPTLPR